MEGAVHMAFGSKMDHIVDLVFGKERFQCFLIRYVRLNKNVAWISFYGFQIFKIPGIGQGIHVKNADIRVFVEHVQNKVAADEPGATGDQIGFHYSSSLEIESRYCPYSVIFSSSPKVCSCARLMKPRRQAISSRQEM